MMQSFPDLGGAPHIAKELDELVSAVFMVPCNVTHDLCLPVVLDIVRSYIVQLPGLDRTVHLLCSVKPAALFLLLGCHRLKLLPILSPVFYILLLIHLMEYQFSTLFRSEG